MANKEECTRARKKALALLTDMDRTENQLREKLAKAGFEADVVNDAIEYVRSYGYIDDDRYADHYIEILKESRSRKRIEQDLVMKKGLSKQQVYDALERMGEWDERDLIRRLAQKKARSMDLSTPEARRKIANFLLRQGFRTGDVLAVLEGFFLDSDS